MSDRTQDEPVMDGAMDDMSDSGTGKAEANELHVEHGDDEIDPPGDGEKE